MTTIDSKSAGRRMSVLSPAAYRIPWHVDRRHTPTYRLVNSGSEPLWGVSLSVSGAAVIRVTTPRRLKPGECLAVTVRGRDIERNTVLIVRWFRPNGDEYLWRVSF